MDAFSKRRKIMLSLKIDETIEIFKRHGFYLAKMKSPETEM